ncbi:uncharacterized protein LOC144420995 [Styela clava]
MWKRDESRVWVRPSDVRYTQDSILPYFQNGDTIQDVARKILQRELNFDDIPLIKIIEMNNKFWSLDNRRLHLLKFLENHNFLKLVKVRLVDKSRLPKEKFTTNNDGISIRIRRGSDNFIDRYNQPNVDRARLHTRSNEFSMSSSRSGVKLWNETHYSPPRVNRESPRGRQTQSQEPSGLAIFIALLFVILLYFLAIFLDKKP